MSAVISRPSLTERSWHRGWLALAGLYYVAIVLGHLEFSLWLVRGREAPWGAYAFSQAVPVLVLLASVSLLFLLGRAMRNMSPVRRRETARFWLPWGLCLVVVDRWLTFSLNETAHYPQYALLAWLLARAFDPRRTGHSFMALLGLGSLLGALDEAAQYLWITVSYSRYYDFNDVLVNLLAVAAGLRWHALNLKEPAAKLSVSDPASSGLSAFRPSRSARPALLALCALLAPLALLVSYGLASGRLALTPPTEVPPGGWLVERQATGAIPTLYLQRGSNEYGRWHEGPRHGRYWVLSPAQGAGCLLLATLLLAGRRRPEGQGRRDA